jgi:hypothetical protein
MFDFVFTVASVISSSADFPRTHNCPATLAGGQFCSASVTFQPTTYGHRKGSLTFKLTGAASKSVPLTGDAALVSLTFHNTLPEPTLPEPT